MIYVQSNLDDKKRVALWERDDRHPHGEVFVTGSRVVAVYPTAAVNQRLRDGVLVEVIAESPAVSSIDGIGKTREKKLVKAGVSTVADLLTADIEQVSVATGYSVDLLTSWQEAAR